MSSPNSVDQSGFSERLRRAREARGLSQTELAERTGLQPSAISHFESGRRAPSFDNLKRLANALDVSTDYLFGREPALSATGPHVDKIFRHLTDLKQQDIDQIEQFAAFLANAKSTKKHKGTGRGGKD
ncbi:MAG: helix-turn-helix transcriptional regulator [Planctomycetes bacterium]|nr:helix-turn-helix transcriptional regulator [Planctomycetota bacterium]